MNKIRKITVLVCGWIYEKHKTFALYVPAYIHALLNMDFAHEVLNYFWFKAVGAFMMRKMFN